MTAVVFEVCSMIITITRTTPSQEKPRQMTTATLTAGPSTDVLAEVRRRAYALVRREWPQLEADEIAQQTVIRYWEAAEKGCVESLGGWVRVTVRRLAIDDHRQRYGRQPAALPREMLLELDEIDRHWDRIAASPSMLVIGGEVQRRVVDLLPERDADLFLRRLRGTPARSVAEELGITPAAVDQGYRRAKLRLRELIAADPQLLEDLRDGRRGRPGPGWAGR